MKKPEYLAEQFLLFKPPNGSAIKPQVRSPFHKSKELSHPSDRRMSDRYTIFTDGACFPNPGPGGWCAIIVYRNQIIAQLSGHDRLTTNNRAEIAPVIAGLKYVPTHCGVDVFTDSQYVQQGCSRWITNWQRRHWQATRRGDKIKNADLWREIAELKRTRYCAFHWVRGHNGNVLNEKCDEIASQCSRSQSSVDYLDELTLMDPEQWLSALNLKTVKG